MTVGQAPEAPEDPKRATSVVGGAVRALLVELAREEASVRRAFAARGAAALLPGVAVHPATVEEVPVAAAVVVAGKQDKGDKD
jgi:hypothetical protein